MHESLRMSLQRQEVCNTKKAVHAMPVLIKVNLDVDTVSPPSTQTSVTSLN